MVADFGEAFRSWRLARREKPNSFDRGAIRHQRNTERANVFSFFKGLAAFIAVQWSGCAAVIVLPLYFCLFTITTPNKHKHTPRFSLRTLTIKNGPHDTQRSTPETLPVFYRLCVSVRYQVRISLTHNLTYISSGRAHRLSGTLKRSFVLLPKVLFVVLNLVVYSTVYTVLLLCAFTLTTTKEYFFCAADFADGEQFAPVDFH